MSFKPGNMPAIELIASYAPNEVPQLGVRPFCGGELELVTLSPSGVRCLLQHSTFFATASNNSLPSKV